MGSIKFERCEKKSAHSSRTIYCIAHAQYHQSQDLRDGGPRPTFLLHFNAHLLTFQDILECLTVYQYVSLRLME